MNVKQDYYRAHFRFVATISNDVKDVDGIEDSNSDKYNDGILDKEVGNEVDNYLNMLGMEGDEEGISDENVDSEKEGGQDNFLDLLMEDEGGSESDSNTDSDAESMAVEDSTSKSRKQRAKRKKQKIPSSSSPIPESSIPIQQSKANAELLFDSIAPHVDVEVLHGLLDKMEDFELAMEEEWNRDDTTSTKRAKKKGRGKISKKKMKEYKTLIGMVDNFFSPNKTYKKNRKTSKKKDSNHILKDHPWIQNLVAQFLAGSISTENPTPTAYESPPTLSMDIILKDSSFPPNIQEKSFEKNVQTLMRVREMSIKSSKSILWSRNQRRKEFQTRKREEKEREQNQSREQNEEVEMTQQEESKDDNEDEFYFTPPDKLREEAETLAKILAYRIPIGSHEKLMTRLEEYADVVEASLRNRDADSELEGEENSRHQDGEEPVNDDDNKDRKPPIVKENMRYLIPNLQRCVGFHLHLIVLELADFFYMDIPDSIQQERKDVINYSIATGDANTNIGAIEADEMRGLQIIRSDSRIHDAWMEWNELREDLAKVFIATQHMYCRLHSTKQKKEKAKKAENKERIPDEKQVEKIMIRYSNEEHTKAQNLLKELDRLRTASDGTMVGRNHLDTKVASGQAPKMANLRFECILLNNEFGAYATMENACLADLGDANPATPSQEVMEMLPETTKTIYVDNLPIDVTKEELESLYSRCGPLASIDIYNLRPDLDPGELSESKRRELVKKNRKSGSKGATQYKTRRTPVYARIEFSTGEGYRVATMDMLRIFGMVIRRHAVRSIPARELTKVYIEGIPQGFYAIDIEEKLSKVLHPRMYASLKLGQHVNSRPRSCELTFPTFEVASFAYDQLKKVRFGEQEQPEIHWMRTPEDAEEYWKRNIIPEP